MRGLFVPVLFLLLCACVGTAKTPAQRGDFLQRSGNLREAETEYERVMGTELAQDEWSYARDQLCATRMRRSKATLSLESKKLQDEELLTLRKELRQCTELRESIAKADSLWLERHMKRLESDVQPLIDQEMYWAALTVAAPLWAALPADNSKADWYGDLKSKAFESLVERAQQWQDMPVVTQILTELAWSTGGGTIAKIEALALAQSIAFGERLATVIEVSPGCQPVAKPLGTLPLPVVDQAMQSTLHILVDECSEEVSVVSDTESYTVIETQQVEKETDVIHISNHGKPFESDLGKKCTATYQWGREKTCTAWVRTSYNEGTRVLTQTISILVNVQVPVTREREIKRFRRTLHATAKVQVAVAQKLLSQTVTKDQTTIAGRFDPGQVPERAPSELFVSQTLSLRNALLEAAEQTAASMTIAHHSQQLRVRAAELQSSGQDREATELCAIASVASDADGGSCRKLLAAQLKLPQATFTPYQPQNLGAIANEATLQTTHFPSSSTTQLVLSKGYPAAAFSLGAQMQRAPAIVGQPRRSGLSGVFQTEFDFYGIAMENVHGWVGFLPVTLRLFIGAQVSETYEFPAPNGSSVTEEGSWNAGIDASVGALFGHRSPKFGVFGGVLAGYQGQLLGAFRQSGTYLPLAARLELRLTERYPLIANVWGFDLNDDDQYSRGASLLVPYRTGLWLTAWVRQTRTSSETEGLRSDDIIDLKNQTLTSASLGLTFSY